MVVTISLSPQGRAYTRALKSEKSLSPFAFASILKGKAKIPTIDIEDLFIVEYI